MLNRRGFTAGLLGVATVPGPALALPSRPERSRVTLAVAGRTSIYHLPLTIAEQRGYFRAEGLDVDIVDVAGASRALQALANGTIAGAGLDVFEREPAVPEALWSMEQVVLTPHIGSATHETRQAMAALACDNLRAHLAGQPMPAPVPEWAERAGA